MRSLDFLVPSETLFFCLNSRECVHQNYLPPRWIQTFRLLNRLIFIEVEANQLDAARSRSPSTNYGRILTPVGQVLLPGRIGSAWNPVFDSV